MVPHGKSTPKCQRKFHTIMETQLLLRPNISSPLIKPLSGKPPELLLLRNSKNLMPGEVKVLLLHGENFLKERFHMIMEILLPSRPNTSSLWIKLLVLNP